MDINTKRIKFYYKISLRKYYGLKSLLWDNKGDSIWGSSVTLEKENSTLIQCSGSIPEYKYHSFD